VAYEKVLFTKVPEESNHLYLVHIVLCVGVLSLTFLWTRYHIWTEWLEEFYFFMLAS